MDDRPIGDMTGSELREQLVAALVAAVRKDTTILDRALRHGCQGFAHLKIHELLTCAGANWASRDQEVAWLVREIQRRRMYLRPVGCRPSVRRFLEVLEPTPTRFTEANMQT